MWRRHERGQVRVGRGYNGTGEVLLKTDITPAYTSLLESYKSSSSSTFQQLWSLMYIVYYWSNS